MPLITVYDDEGKPVQYRDKPKASQMQTVIQNTIAIAKRVSELETRIAELEKKLALKKTT
jgi:hypothetical protein